MLLSCFRVCHQHIKVLAAERRKEVQGFAHLHIVTIIAMLCRRLLLAAQAHPAGQGGLQLADSLAHPVHQSSKRIAASESASMETNKKLLYSLEYLEA